MRGEPGEGKVVGGHGVGDLDDVNEEGSYKGEIRKREAASYDRSVVIHFGHEIAQRNIFPGGITRVWRRRLGGDIGELGV